MMILNLQIAFILLWLIFPAWISSSIRWEIGMESSFENRGLIYVPILFAMKRFFYAD